MLLPRGTMFAIVDGGKFELYRNTGIEAAPCLEAMPVPDLEATNYSAGVYDHDRISRFPTEVPKNRVARLDEAGHAAAVAQWLNRQVLMRRIDKLVVIADPRTLGELRRHYHKEVQGVLLAEVPKTLTGGRTTEIVRVLHG
ncbi:host attachment protein [Novosphingobium sp.]|uniref:baeRF12 domain-containing protein n=1 Tax=Novosphingobium sp. TaxID=1874826 RepID=UPI002B460E52|nr:host attachment protein [Novosphingobium sp.]HKR93367.1 host attachment protein [Novosphingobium sp.]